MNDIAIMYSESELRNIAQAVIQEAKKLGADEAEVSVAANKGFSVSVHNKDVEHIEYNQNKIIDIQVMFGKRTGSASVTDINKASWQKAVEAACHIAKFTDNDPDSGIALPDELAFNYPELELAKHWPITVSDAIRLATLCESVALSADKRIMNVEEVQLSTSEAWYVYANSNGFVGAYPDSHHELTCVLVAKENKEMQRDYSYTIASDPGQLLSPEQVAKEAVDKTIKRLGARSLPTMKAPVIFQAEVARSFIGHFAAAIKGAALYRKASFLYGHLDEKIFPDFINVQEFPHIPFGLGSAPFDDDGVLTKNNIFVEDGILRQYALGVYSARKLKMQSTGNAGGFHNLTIKTGNDSFEELIKKMNKGLIVTELMGQGVNLTTGNYSRGAGGFWVEHGEIQYPVHEITIAGFLPSLYKNIAAIANDVDYRGNLLTGSILVNEMMIAGT